MNKQPIVITGMGVISSIGLNVEKFWESLKAGRSGVNTITRFDTTNFPAKVAAEVKGFNPEDHMDSKTVERTAWTSQMAIAATKEAMESARLDMSKEDKTRVGVVGSTMLDQDYLIHGSEVLGGKGQLMVDPLLLLKGGPYSVAQEVGALVGCTGPCTSVNTVCASGGDAIGAALNFIRLGYADVMVACGSDSNIAPLGLYVLWRIGALTREADPAKACRPYDLNRTGFAVGEGAATVVLETLEHARRRGAPIQAEVAGVGWSFDASSVTAPQAETQALAMKLALRNAAVRPEEIDYINPHGTGTRLNDSCETKAIKIAFGKRAYKIPVSSTKSMHGHSATADGALEIIATVLMINRGIIPPTINYETPDPECDLDYVPNVARQARVNIGMSNDWGLGGQNVSIIVRRFEDR